VAAPEIGAIVIYGKKGFCGFLGGSYVSVSVGPLALKKMGISSPHCYTAYRNGTVPIADSRHGGGVNEVAGVGIKARMYMYLYTFVYTRVYVDAAGDTDRDAAIIEKPQAEERTREEGGKEEGRGNAGRGGVLRLNHM
jgi:hypothetical protein